jgi:O-acetylhomoserine (thiol)-lyase
MAPMKRETIAIHGGFDSDPATNAVAVPIYQTAAYAFDSAEHGAALFNLEIEGYRYSRISNPTTDILEQRVTQLEGGVGALCVSSGQTALYYAALNFTEMGRNIVSVPQLYGTTYTLFAHILPKLGRASALREERPRPGSRGTDRRGTRARSFAKPSATPPATSATSKRSRRVAHRHAHAADRGQHRPDADAGAAGEYGADIVVHSLTKFMGGHGTTSAASSSTAAGSWTKHAARYPMFTRAGPPIMDWSTRSISEPPHSSAAAAASTCAPARVLSPINAFLLLQGIETVALRVERHVENARQGRRISARRPARRIGQFRGISRQSVLSAGAEISWAAGPARS